MSNVGVILSTMEEYHDARGGYHEYRGGGRGGIFCYLSTPWY